MVDTQIIDKAKDEDVFELFTPHLISVFGDSVTDEINQFGCEKLAKMHLFLQNPAAEGKFWRESLDKYKKLGIFESISDAYDRVFEPKVFDYLGMQLAADMATHMTALREQYNVSAINSLGKLSYAEWDELERIIMTRQYGIFDQYIIDFKNTRIFKNFFRKLDRKIDCIRAHNNVYTNTSCHLEMPSYIHYMQHDIALITLINLFDLEQ